MDSKDEMTGKRPQPSSKEMLAEALSRAHAAVALDTANEVRPALQAYGDAVDILGGLMIRAKEKEKAKLAAISRTYEERIRLLRAIGEEDLDDVVPIMSSIRLSQNAHDRQRLSPPPAQTYDTTEATYLQLPMNSPTSSRLRTISGHEVEAVHISPLIPPSLESRAHSDRRRNVQQPDDPFKTDSVAVSNTLPPLETALPTTTNDGQPSPKFNPRVGQDTRAKESSVSPRTTAAANVNKSSGRHRDLSNNMNGNPPINSPGEDSALRSGTTKDVTMQRSSHMQSAAREPVFAPPLSKEDLAYCLLQQIAFSIIAPKEVRDSRLTTSSEAYCGILKYGMTIPQSLWEVSESLAMTWPRIQVMEQKVKACETACLALNDLHLALPAVADIKAGKHGSDRMMRKPRSGVDIVSLTDRLRGGLQYAQTQLPKRSEMRKVSGSLQSTPILTSSLGGMSPQLQDSKNKQRFDSEVISARYVRSIHELATKAQIIPLIRTMATQSKQAEWVPLLKEADQFFAGHVIGFVLKDIQTMIEIRLRQGLMNLTG